MRNVLNEPHSTRVEHRPSLRAVLIGARFIESFRLAIMRFDPMLVTSSNGTQQCRHIPSVAAIFPVFHKYDRDDLLHLNGSVSCFDGSQ